jgi:Predicted flavoprotein involved in K+ transport
MSTAQRPAAERATTVDAVVIGAGFTGLYMLHKLRDQMGMTVRVFEVGDGVGGTWYWNRYPGARSDSDSYLYSYSFDKELQQEWQWSERYPVQHEILSYLEHVADRHDLRRDITFGTRVQSATFDEGAGTWTVATDGGETVTAQFLISGVGGLSASNIPDFPGLDSYRGETYHTGHWPHEGVDFTGKRVGIIGTGASAVQSIPLIAQQAADLTVFQRTANYIVPARNGPVDPEIVASRKANYDEHRHNARYSFAGFDHYQFIDKGALEDTEEQRQAEFQGRWDMGGFGLWLANYNDIFFSDESNKTVRDFLDARIRATVRDPETAELLVPKGHAFGCKRNPLDSGYYETFNLETVHLVSVADNPIAAITPKGTRLTDGSEFELDAIVFATGFDAMTGPINKIDIRGRGGQLLRDKWHAGPHTYLGLMSAGYPNLFTITGPQSPSVLSNMPTSIEQHVEFTAQIIGAVRDRGEQLVEPAKEAEDAWVEHAQELANASLFPQANSWYMGANIPGKPRVFLPYLGGVGGYRQKCEEVVENGFEGFVFTGAKQGAMA